MKFIKKNVLKNQGFTLVELLATIAVLGVIASITIFVTTNLIGSARENGYKVTINNIEKAASSYVAEYGNELGWTSNPNSEIETYCVSVQELIDAGYFSNDILSSEISKDTKIEIGDMIYIDRNADKVIVKEELPIDEEAINNREGISCSSGRVIISTDPYGWSNKKTITITYKISESETNFENYSYNYIIDYDSEDDTDYKSSKEKFTGATATTKFEVTKDKTFIKAMIYDKDGEEIDSKSYTVINIDNEKPKLNVEADNNEYAKTHSVILELSDELSGIKKENYEVKYELGDDSTGLNCNELSNVKTITVDTNVKKAIKEVTESLNFDGNYDGEKILYWCLNSSVSDNVGNVLENASGSITLNFDNTKPSIEFSPDGGTVQEKSFNSDVKVSDNKSGLKEIKYKWTDSLSQPNSFNEEIVVNKETEITKKINGNIDKSDLYLWVKATDMAGNVEVTHSNPFKLSERDLTFKISYELNGGVAAETGMPSEYIGSVGAIISGVPTKTGSEFKGWATSGACLNAVNPRIISAASTGDKKFYACFDPIKYKISYIGTVGIIVTDNLVLRHYSDPIFENSLDYPLNYKYGVGATISGIPKSDGYYFKGFDINSNCSNPKMPPIVIPATSESNITYYNCFVPATYSITYYDGNTKYTDLTPTSYVYNTYRTQTEQETLGITLAKPPEKEGYVFKGWCEKNDSDCSNLVLGIPSSGFGDKTYYAKWEEKTDNMYHIEYRMYGSFRGMIDLDLEYKNLYPNYYKSGEETTLPILEDFYALTNPGYVFIGWCDGGRKTYNCTKANAKMKISSNETGDKVYYAGFAGATYNITYDLKGGTFTSTEGLPTSYIYSGKPSATIEAVSDPIKEGYEFEGWSMPILEGSIKGVTFDVSKRQVIKALSRGDYTLFAIWKKVSPDYELTFYPDPKQHLTPDPTLFKLYKEGDEFDLPVLNNIGDDKFIGWCESNNISDCLVDGKIVTKIQKTDTGDKKFWAVYETNRFMYSRCDAYYVTKYVGYTRHYTSLNNIDNLSAILEYTLYDEISDGCNVNYCTPVIEGYNTANKSIDFRTVDANLAINYGEHIDREICKTKEVNSSFGKIDADNFNPFISGSAATDGKCNATINGNVTNVGFAKIGSGSFCNINFVYNTKTNNTNDMDNMRLTNCTGYDNLNYNGTYYCLLPNKKIGSEYLPLASQCALATTCVQGDG